MAGVALRLSHFQINPQPSSYLHHQAYSIFLPFQLVMLNLITCFSARQQIHLVILFHILSLLTPSFDIWICCLCVEERKLSVPLLSHKDICVNSAMEVKKELQHVDYVTQAVTSGKSNIHFALFKPVW